MVDNGSRDGSADALERDGGPARVIRAGKNLGFAGGTNLGVRHSNGEVVIFLNPDTEAASDFVAVVREALLQDRTIGVLGAKIYDPGWTVIQHAGGLLRENALSDHVGRGEEDRGQHDVMREYAYVTGAALAIRRDVLDHVGLLDPYYRFGYFEETDLCFRVRRAGYRVVYEPRARVVHHEGTASKKFSPRFFYIYHRNRLRFVLRNFPPHAIARRFLPAEIDWMRRDMPPEQRWPLLWAYAVNGLRAPLTLLGF